MSYRCLDQIFASSPVAATGFKELQYSAATVATQSSFEPWDRL